ncbi:MAG: FAD-binding oxidoreductase [Candidatus Omnitrophica bacterium]|nr:FAD-binding oxidoreductase [Candidatus Omnitrophota bacterium]
MNMIIKRDVDFIKCYFEDQSGLLGGNADEALLPENQEEAAVILKDYGSKSRPVTISGGGTGVTGARVPFSGTILATDSLNKIINIDKKNMFATLEPGVRLSDLQRELSGDGLIYLPDPAEPNAFLGGTVSTNASGAKGFKYGPTRNYIKRLKVALSTGDVLNIERGKIFAKKKSGISLPLKNKEMRIKLPSYSMPAIKSAAGYYIKDTMDLVDLFIGQEGTLGLILEVDVALGKRPESVMSFFSFFSSERDALSFIREARLKNALSIEYMDSNSLDLLRSRHSNIPAGSAAMVYFEQDCKKDYEEHVVDSWMELLKKHAALMDKTYFADSEREREKLAELRHALPEMINEIVKRNKLPKVGTDIAVPGEAFQEMFRFYKEKLVPSGIDFVIFGHIGENHMHVNMLPKSEEEFRKSKAVYMDFVKKAVSLDGTVSAEHGIGKLKHAFLEVMYGKDAIKEMAELKKSLDPACILGLDNIFPKELLK